MKKIFKVISILLLVIMSITVCTLCKILKSCIPIPWDTDKGILTFSREKQYKCELRLITQ